MRLRIISCLALSLFFVLTITVPSVHALDPEQRRVIDSGSSYFDIEETIYCTAPTLATTVDEIAAGSQLFFLGDSLTVGMRDLGDLSGAVEEAGWQVSGVVAEIGRSISWGVEQINARQTEVSNSDVLVVGLGTNNVADVVNGSEVVEGGEELITELASSLVTAATTINPAIEIRWITTYIRGSSAGNNLTIAGPVINQGIENVASSQTNVSIIPWGSSSVAASNLSGDGLHPENYPAMTRYIITQLTDPEEEFSGPAGLAGCSCNVNSPIVESATTKEERYQNAWNYLTDEAAGIGLSEQAAAGIMGNLEVESAGTMDPQVVEFSAGYPDNRSPEIPIDFTAATGSKGPIFRGSYGYGLAQWTFETRQDALIAYATETGRSTGSMDLQLDFLFKELSELFTGVLAVMENPSVTINEASDSFLLEFERPRSVIDGGASRQNEINNRRERANRIFNEYTGTGGSYTGASCAAGTTVDTESRDTTAILCATGTRTVDENALGFRNGEEYRIRTCEYEGAVVNSQISAAVKSLIDDARAAGANITFTGGGGGGFRTMDGQVAIYESHCSSGGYTPTPGPYPKPLEDYQSCPGGAPPGYSNHQLGLALDIECNEVLLPRAYSEALDNECFNWLVSNASSYGLYEFGRGQDRDSEGYEAWHWSIDGN